MWKMLSLLIRQAWWCMSAILGGLRQEDCCEFEVIKASVRPSLYKEKGVNEK